MPRIRFDMRTHRHLGKILELDRNRMAAGGGAKQSSGTSPRLKSPQSR